MVNKTSGRDLAFTVRGGQAEVDESPDFFAVVGAVADLPLNP
jgi:hypothetical protein